MNDTRFYMKELSHSSVTGITRYAIFEEATGLIVVETNSLRRYIAVLIRKHWHSPDKWYVQYRFGRPELIGKGNSKLSIDRPDAYLARLR